MINRLADLPSRNSKHNGGSNKPSDPFAAIDLPKMIEPVEQLIVKNSALALIVAFAVGVTIACLVKRR
jgi:hypothetical protein